MRTYIIFIIMCIWRISLSFAQTNNSLDSIRWQFEQEAAQMHIDFEEYEKKVRADYFRYVDSIKKVWGGDTIIDNTPKIWVEYGAEFCSRSIVDFENGTVEVEIAIDEKENLIRINDRMVKAIERMLDSRGSTYPYSFSENVADPLTARPILEGLIDFSQFDFELSDSIFEQLPQKKRPLPPSPTVKGHNLNVNQTLTESIVSNQKMVNESKKKTLAEKRKEGRLEGKKKAEQISGKINNSLLAKQIAMNAKKKVEVIRGNDGVTRQVIKVQMALVSDNLSRNAALYKDLVVEFSQKFQIEQPLIYAIMEQESAFNPQATSWVPAYGLMQLVPSSGGRDAYRYVYKVDKKPDMSYLYNPRNNIELGTAYLRVLMNQFARVEDPHCRRLCVIASYNTGPGNVSRSFIGTTNLNNAFSVINRHDYNGLYTHLVTNLPYEETRKYVAKVTQRREKYMKQK